MMVSLSGESDAINKLSFSEIEVYRHTDPEYAHKDCFIILGSKVLGGVGNKSFNGCIMVSELYANY